MLYRSQGGSRLGSRLAPEGFVCFISDARRHSFASSPTIPSHAAALASRLQVQTSLARSLWPLLPPVFWIPARRSACVHQGPQRLPHVMEFTQRRVELLGVEGPLRLVSRSALAAATQIHDQEQQDADGEQCDEAGQHGESGMGELPHSSALALALQNPQLRTSRRSHNSSRLIGRRSLPTGSLQTTRRTTSRDNGSFRAVERRRESRQVNPLRRCTTAADYSCAAIPAGRRQPIYSRCLTASSR